MSIMTVRGPVDAAELGFTHCHEHVLIDMARAHGVWSFDGLLDDREVAVAELVAFREAGGGAVVEVTTADLGRDPEGLRDVSERSGVHIVMATGYYRQPYYPPDLDRTSTAAIARWMLDEIADGVGDTGIRPGIIGEIGSDKTWVSAQEERVFRAAARAQSESGLPLMTHTPPGGALVQLELLTDAGADLCRVAMGHSDGKLDLDYHEALLAHGVFLSFDLIGTTHYPDARRARHLAELIRRGHADRLLLAMDICHRQRLRAWDGPGFPHLRERFLPLLREAGVSDAAIDALTVENPARFLALP